MQSGCPSILRATQAPPPPSVANGVVLDANSVDLAPRIEREFSERILHHTGVARLRRGVAGLHAREGAEHVGTPMALGTAPGLFNATRGRFHPTRRPFHARRGPFGMVGAARDPAGGPCDATRLIRRDAVFNSGGTAGPFHSEPASFNPRRLIRRMTATIFEGTAGPFRPPHASFDAAGLVRWMARLIPRMARLIPRMEPLIPRMAVTIFDGMAVPSRMKVVEWRRTRLELRTPSLASRGMRRH